MSPEQAEGLPVGPASDVFALGSVIAFAATGAAPFGGGTSSPIVVAYRVVHAQPDLSHIPVPLTNLVTACLAKNPAGRPQLAQLMDAIRDGSAPYQAGWPGSFWPEPVAEMISSRQDSFHPPSRGKALLTTVQLWARRRLHLRWPAQARWRVLTVVIVAAVLFGAGAISIALIHSRPAPGPAGAGLPTPTAIRAAAAAHAAAARWIAAQVSADAIVSCDPQMCALLEAHGIPAGRLLPLGGSNPAPLGSDLIVSTAAVRSEFGARLSNVYAPVVLASFGTGSAQTAVRVVAADGTAAYLRSLRADRAARAFAGRQLLRNSRLHASGPARHALAAGQVDSRLLTAFAALATLHRVDVVDFPAPAAGRARACRCGPRTSPRPGRGSGTGPTRWPRWPVSCGISWPRSGPRASPSSGWPAAVRYCASSTAHPPPSDCSRGSDRRAGDMARCRPSVLGDGFSGSAPTAAGVWYFVSSSLLWPFR